MHIFRVKSKIVVSCKTRLSQVLAKEIRDLGYEVKRVFITGVELEGTMADCIKLNLNLYTASQVLFSIKSFYCNSPEQLYDELIKVKWQQIIDPDTYFSITSNVKHSSINNDLFANVKVKDAIVDVMQEVYNRRPDTGPNKDKVVINLFWKDSDAEIFVDTSGETLAKHGYRKIPGKAPMLESLAAACILSSKWDKQTHFINPMCGAGTLAIEAALICTHRKPGLYRTNYSFMHLNNYADDVYEAELKLLREQVIPKPGIQIIANDRDAKALANTRINAEYAGVLDLIDYVGGDFEQIDIPQFEKGVVMLNPEYGERLGHIEELETTYKKIGDFFKQRCKGYFGYIFTGNLDLAKKVGLKASKRTEFFNGAIDSRLLEFELYDGSKPKPNREEG